MVILLKNIDKIKKIFVFRNDILKHFVILPHNNLIKLGVIWKNS